MNPITKLIAGMQASALAPDNAINLLKGDHRKVEGLFKQYEDSEANDEKETLKQNIIKELSVHADVEEELVYPILQKEEKDKALEANEEHHVVKLLLAELSTMSVKDSKTSAKVKVLSEIVEHHVKEEEGELFPMLQQTGTDLDALGQQILVRKEQLSNEYSKPGSKVNEWKRFRLSELNQEDDENADVENRASKSVSDRTTGKRTNAKAQGNSTSAKRLETVKQGAAKKAGIAKKSGAAKTENVRSIASAKSGAAKSKATTAAKPARATKPAKKTNLTKATKRNGKAIAKSAKNKPARASKSKKAS